MDPFHDIYRKEDPPFLRKRRRRSRYSSDHNGPREGAPAPASPSATSHGESRPSSSSHHHHHRSHRRHLGAKLLWIVLAAGVCVYVAFLAVSVIRGARQSARAAAAKKGDEGAAPAAAVAASTATAQRIEARIAEWARIPDVIVEAQTFVDQGLPDQAIERLNRALESTPNIARLHVRAAQICAQEGRHAQAEDHLIRALESDPDHSPTRLLLARCYEAQTNHAGALAVSKWILQTEPNSVPALQIAADAYLQTDRRGLAIPHLRKIISLDRENSTAAQNQLAVAYVQMGEYVKAIQLFNELLARDTRDSVTYYNLAVCYAKQGMADQCVEVLAKSIGLFGKDFVATWLKSKDFDTLRGDAQFIALGEDEKKGDRKTPAVARPE